MTIEFQRRGREGKPLKGAIIWQNQDVPLTVPKPSPSPLTSSHFTLTLELGGRTIAEGEERWLSYRCVFVLSHPPPSGLDQGCSRERRLTMTERSRGVWRCRSQGGLCLACPVCNFGGQHLARVLCSLSYMGPIEHRRLQGVLGRTCL